MRRVKEVLRQRLLLRRTHREIASCLGIGAGTVGDTLGRAKNANVLDWNELADVSEDELGKRLYGPKLRVGAARQLPDAAWMDVELRKRGVTLQLLHLEYLEGNP